MSLINLPSSLYQSRASYASSDQGFDEVQLRSQVWKHFKRNKQGFCRCNYCGVLFRPLQQSTTVMAIHLNRVHSQQIYGYGRSKKQQQQILTDFIENLAFHGYPADKFVEGMLKLFTFYEDSFQRLLCKMIGDLPQARESIPELIQALPIQTDKDIVQQIIFQFFPNLSIGTRKQLLQEYFWVYSNQQEIILNFRQHGYNILTRYEEDNINLMMLITDSMKSMYKKYGDCLCIDTVEKVYRKKSPYGFADYSTWFFTGEDENLQTVIFAFAITNQQNDKNIQFLFKNFFEKMDHLYPISICIPPYIIFQEQLKKIAPSVMIILNWYHKLRFLKEILEQQIEHQSILRSICQCFKTSSQAQYDFLMKRIMSKVSDQHAIKYGVQKCKQNFCIFKIPHKYIGFSIQTSRYMNLERRIRETFVYQGNLARLFIYVIKLQKKMNYTQFSQEAERTSFINNEQSHKLQSLIEQIQSSNLVQTKQGVFLDHYRISDQIKKRIDVSFSQLGNHRMDIIDPITVKFFSRKTHISKWRVFTIQYQVEHQYWQCNCKFLKHTGVPCSHLIKVIQHFGGDEKLYCNPRWLVKING